MNAQDNARAGGSLQWATARLFKLFGGWVRCVDDPADAVWLARTSRQLGWHVLHFAEIRPDSVLLDGSLVHDPHGFPANELTRALLEDLATTSGDHVGVASALVDLLRSQIQALRAVCDPNTDGALRRALDFLMVDLDTARSEQVRQSAALPAEIHFVTPVGQQC